MEHFPIFDAARSTNGYCPQRSHSDSIALPVTEEVRALTKMTIWVNDIRVHYRAGER